MGDNLTALEPSLNTDELFNFDYVIKRQRRKTIALHVLDDATVEVRAPKWVPKIELIKFVEQRVDWIVEQRHKRIQKLALKPQFKDGQYHYYLGERYRLNISVAGRASVDVLDDCLFLKVRDPSNTEQIRKALEGWYRSQASECFEQRLFFCFESFPDWFQDKYIMPKIIIRKMRRRWGSCSSKGEVTLNLMLMKMPLACIDYVITHELCHFEAFHHGASFYQLLSAVMPDWKERELLIEASS
jgi:predicted metal-dependent hydrolase